MANLIYGIMEKLLHGRNALDLTTSEARELVADFYAEIESRTIQCVDKAKIDSISSEVLRAYGLEYFIA